MMTALILSKQAKVLLVTYGIQKLIRMEYLLLCPGPTNYLIFP